MAQGQCNCGTVVFEFEISPDLRGVIVCHCSICRRATGSNGIAIVLADKRDFRWISGKDQISNWRKPDSDWEIWFCKSCGSPVPGSNDDTRVFIPAGLFADDDFEVIHHIYVDSRAAWDEIGDAGKQHRGAYEGS